MVSEAGVELVSIENEINDNVPDEFRMEQMLHQTLIIQMHSRQRVRL